MTNQALVTVGVGQYSLSGKVITLTGIDVTQESLAYVYNFTQNKLYYAPAEGLAKATVSGGTITIDSTFDDLGASDVLHIQIFTAGGFDYDLDALKVLNQTTYERKHTDEEHIVDAEDGADGVITYHVFDLLKSGYTMTSFHYKLFADTADDTVALKLYASNNPAADDSAATDWVDITSTIFGGAVSANNTTLESIGVIDLDFPVARLMVTIETTYGGGGSANNSSDVYIIRSN